MSARDDDNNNNNIIINIIFGNFLSLDVSIRFVLSFGVRLVELLRAANQIESHDWRRSRANR
jgi:hypothetical protein